MKLHKQFTTMREIECLIMITKLIDKITINKLKRKMIKLKSEALML